MTEYRDIPTETVPAGGIAIDLGQGGVSPSNGVFITIVETAGVAWTVQVLDKNNSYSAPLSVAASSPYQAKKVPNVRFINITGSGAQVTGKVTDYEIAPDAIMVSAPVTISGTVDTHTLQDDSWANFSGYKVPAGANTGVLTDTNPPP